MKKLLSQKKIFSLMLAIVMVLSMTACGSNTKTADGGIQDENLSDPETVVVTGRDSAGEAIEVTVPYKPERVVVLVLANLDILDNLGLGDRIVGAPTITLPCIL